jgi:light-regulated signal transduction histidine kinase (bacteriophytochrome)
MIYSFDEEWNGTVIAQEMEAGMDDYLGLKFPASDVPKPVRDMYLITPYRFIPDREYNPSKVLSYPGCTAGTDFTNCK